MMPLCWWLVDMMSRALEPDERDAVRGDFAESGETGERALRDMLGLVARRQAALWRQWRSWLTLVGLIIPLGMLLSLVSRLTANQGATYTWMYANNWDVALLRSAGFWHVLADSAAFVLLRYLMLACWSWTAGFVLGSASCRMVWVNGVLFCLMLLFGQLVGAPQYFDYYWRYANRALGVAKLPQSNDPVFALTFYRVMFPLIVQAVLVAVPSLWGMRKGAQVGRLRPLVRVVLWLAAVATLGALVIQEPGFGLFLKVYWRLGSWQWQVRLLNWVVYWPLVYMAASVAGRRWAHKSALS